MKPLIGITGKRGVDQHKPDVDSSIREYDRFFCSYIRAVIEADGIPVLIPLESRCDELVDKLDGVIFSGGADIAPGLYGQSPHPKLGEVQDERDNLELTLAKEVIKAKKPALGICRGLQLFNVATGGTLHQHIDGHSAMLYPPEGQDHLVHFDKGSRLAELYGESHKVNSLHHQSIDKLGDGFKICGRISSGSIEAIEHEELPVLAVQWHPELLEQRATDPIFRWLINTAK